MTSAAAGEPVAVAAASPVSASPESAPASIGRAAQAEPRPVEAESRPGDRVAHVIPAILALLAAGLVLRLVIAYVLFPNQGLATDLGLFGQWAQALARVGPGAFYASATTANYPPGYMYVLWLIGSLGGGLAGVFGVAAGQVDLALLKVPAMLADIGIAALLFVAARRWFGDRRGLLAAGLFLFIPVTWYDSALWGQVDSIGTLVMLAALLLLIDGWSEPAAAMAMLGVLIKPQDLVLLVVVIPVLLRRHLLRVGSGPVPSPKRRIAALDRRLGSWFTQQQGPGRLVTSGFAAAAVFVIPLLPFDLPRLAPASVADLPVISHIAGFVVLMSDTAGQFSVLTANAFNGWALVGPTSLASTIGAGASSQWTPDSLVIAGGLTAVTVGALLLGAVGLAVAGGLLIRDDRMAIILGFTVAAFAFYALPTRVHERYLFPMFATGALLAAGSAAWSAWYIVAGLLNVANLHAVLTLSSSRFGGLRGGGGPGSGGPGGGPGGPGGLGGGFGQGGFGVSASVPNLPFGDLLHTEAAVTLIALGQMTLFVLAFGAWCVYVLRPERGRREARSSLLVSPG